MAQHRFSQNFRLLPATLVVVLIVFGVRIFDAVTLLLGGDAVPAVQTAQAQTKAPPASALPKTEAAAAKPGQSAEPPAALPPPGAPGSGQAAPAAKDNPMQTASATAPAPAKPGAGDARHPAPETNLSSAEVELLQTLSTRRADLDQRAQAVEQREALLKVGEDRLNQKLAELNALKADIEKLLSIRKSKEEQELNNLVNIYSAMKPREAAAIFDGLDMPVLLDVVEKMKEQKVAPIFAAMNPRRAQEVTTRLAERRKLPPSPPPAALQPAALNGPVLPPQPASATPAAAQPAAAAPKPAANSANNKK
jgi:flagellar motility protein MotE (MotC chaperone)